MSIIPHSVDYAPLQQWLDEHRLQWTHLAKQVHCTAQALSHYKSSGRPMPSEWIVTWQRAYKWSWPEACHYCLGAPKPTETEINYEQIGRALMGVLHA